MGLVRMVMILMCLGTLYPDSSTQRLVDSAHNTAVNVLQLLLILLLMLWCLC